MKKITTLLFALITISLIVNAQKLELAERYAGYGQIETVEMNVSAGDTITFVGQYTASNATDVDPGPATVTLPMGSSSFAVYMLKYTDSSTYVSHAGLVSSGSNSISAYSATFDNDDNIYISGTFIGTVDMDPGVGVVNISSTKNSGYVAKYDKNFNLLWANSFTDGNYTYIQDVQVNSVGEVFIAGYYFGTEDLDPSPSTVNINAVATINNFIAKYSPSGSYLNHFENFGRGSIFLDIDKNDNLNVVGSFNVAFDFDPGAGTTTLTPTNSSETFIAQYTSALALNYAYTFANTNTFNIHKINSDNASNLYIQGDFLGSQDFDIGVGIQSLTSGTNRHSFLLKMTQVGTFSWVKQYDWYDFYATNNYPQLIHFDNDDNVYLHNHFTDSINIDYGVSNKTLYASGDKDGYIVKYTTNGNYLWDFRLGGNTPGYNYTQLRTANIDNYGVLRIEGSMRTVNDFDPSPYETFGITNFTSFYNGFYAKYNQLTTGTVVTSICEGNNLTVPYNNPSNLESGNVFTVELSDASGDFSSPIVIGTLNSNANTGVINATIPLGIISSPNYRVRVVSSMPYLTGERNNTDIEVLNLPIINTQPTAITLCEEENALLYVNSPNSVSYEWVMQGTPISGSNNDSLIGTNLVVADQGLYYVELTNSCGTKSSDTVFVTINPIYNSSIVDSVCYGESYTFPDGYIENNIIATTMHTSNLQTVNSCDSIVQTTVSIHQVDTNTSQSGVVLNATAVGSSYQWVDCNNNYAFITGETNSSYTATSNGNYAVVVDDGICTDTSSCMTVVGVGINQLDNKVRVKLYPNPTSTSVNIQLNEVKKGAVLNLYNNIGALVLEKPISAILTTINVGELPQGVYLITINNGGKLINERIIIQ